MTIGEVWDVAEVPGADLWRSGRPQIAPGIWRQSSRMRMLSVMNEAEWWYDAISDKIRDQLTERDEGAIWSLFLDDEHLPVVCAAVDDGIHEMDDVLLEKLAQVLEGVGAPAVAVVVPRHDGKPLGDDVRMSQRLSARLARGSVELVDFLVVGDTQTWVASRDGTAGAAA